MTFKNALVISSIANRTMKKSEPTLTKRTKIFLLRYLCALLFLPGLHAHAQMPPLPPVVRFTNYFVVEASDGTNFSAPTAVLALQTSTNLRQWSDVLVLTGSLAEPARFYRLGIRH
jgi:hypothetical protein